MVTALQDWQRPGCEETCVRRMVIMPGLLGRQTIEIHDPDAHELYGRSLGGDVGGQGVLESGPLALWRHEMRLWVEGVEVALTPREWGVLLAVIDGNGALVTAGEILTRVWGVEFREERHILTVHLARLRRRLGAAAGLIETVAGLGYRFRFVMPGEVAPFQQVTYSSRLPVCTRRAFDRDDVEIGGAP